MASGIFALYLVKDLAPLGSTLKHKHLYEALLAGFGSVSFFRTSLFTLKVSGTDVGIGPSLLLKSVLDCADRSLDRWQAERRGIKIQRLMTNVSFDLAKKALPTTCFTLMTNIDDDLQKNVGEHINQLDEKDLNTEVKNKILGVYLYKLVGDQVLEKALFLLGNSIKTK
ncbi:hypothetical protein [Acetobacter pasteurianus]|uniref:hypothetical protein n=1 Tax=Acetobacter pasteurianus TaxID=438 RepID=UPI0013635AAC|nr:hypothetical protein [Acetobacter pasteurianus]QHM92172.1 hypothetical protein FCN51_11770 [Acetobacter pasteurianus]